MVNSVSDADAGVASDARSSPAPMIEHVVIYPFDASTDVELSLAVDDCVWVSASVLFLLV